MATWTDTTTIAMGITSGKPGIGIGGFGEQVKDNLQYLKDIIDQIGISSDAAIHDDFTANELSVFGSAAAGTEEDFTWDLDTSGVASLSANPQHHLICSHSAAQYAAVAAGPHRMRFDLSLDHTVVYECRHISSQSDNTEVWAFGFQDASLGAGGARGTINSATIITDQSDFIGFVQGATANTYRAITASGGVTTTVATNQGNAAVANDLKLIVTFAGATQNVEFFINGTSIGTSTSNIPNIRLRPIFGCSGGAGSPRQQSADGIHAFWLVRPESF